MVRSASVSGRAFVSNLTCADLVQGDKHLTESPQKIGLHRRVCVYFSLESNTTWTTNSKDLCRKYTVYVGAATRCAVYYLDAARLATERLVLLTEHLWHSITPRVLVTVFTTCNVAQQHHII